MICSRTSLSAQLFAGTFRASCFHATEIRRFASRDRLLWVDHLFAQKPDPSGVWRYSLDYRGRGGSAETFRIRYDAAKERVVGTYEITSDEKLKRAGRWQDAVYWTDPVGWVLV